MGGTPLDGDRSHKRIELVFTGSRSACKDSFVRFPNCPDRSGCCLFFYPNRNTAFAPLRIALSNCRKPCLELSSCATGLVYFCRNSLLPPCSVSCKDER